MTHDSKKIPVTVSVLSDPGRTMPCHLAGDVGRAVRLIAPISLPIGAALQIEYGSSLLLAEVTACRVENAEAILCARVEHAVEQYVNRNQDQILSRVRWHSKPVWGPVDTAGDSFEPFSVKIPSLFGRILALAMLRYFGCLSNDSTLKGPIEKLHGKLFQEWLSLTIEAQKVDLDVFLSGLDGHRRILVETWLRFAPYRAVIPGDVSPAERELYLADFEVLAEVLRGEYISSQGAVAGAAMQHPVASKA